MDNYVYIAMDDSNGGRKKVERYIPTNEAQVASIGRLIDIASDLGLTVKHISKTEYEEFNFLTDEKGIDELKNLLKPKDGDEKFNQGGSVFALKRFKMEDLIIDSDVYKLIRNKEKDGLGNAFLLKFKKQLSTEDFRIISGNLFYIKGHFSPTLDAFVLKSTLSKKEIEKMLDGSSIHNYSVAALSDTPEEVKISDNDNINKYAVIAVENLVKNKGLSKEQASAEIKKGVHDEEEHRETIQKVIDGKISIDEALVEIAYVHILESKTGKFYVK